MNKEYSNIQIVNYLRTMNGISLFIYYTMVLFPNWNFLFSLEGGISPNLFSYYPKSPLFMIWGCDGIKFLLLLLTAGSIFCYTVNFYARSFQIITIVLHLSFHLSNPFIIHEPQQLNNLLLLMLLFLPISNHNSFKHKEEKLADRNTSNILNLMQLYIGLYYLFAAIKKLPDENWLNGKAVGLICSWTYLGKDNWVNYLCQNQQVSLVLTFSTLIFEFLFLLLSFTKYRKYLIYFGIIFHFFIGISLHVGLFFWAMIMWYPLLLKRKD